MKKLIALYSISFLFSFSVFAGGFQVNLQGQKQTGMGHTGTGLCLDNASLFFNPGAVSFLDSMRGVTLGGSFIFPRTAYLNSKLGYIAHTEHHTGTPITLYAVYKFKKRDKWNVGLAIYNPFGSKVQWADDWLGQFLIREIDLKTFFIQPTVSLKLNEKLGVGAGFVYATGDFSLRKGIPLQDSTGKYGEGTLNGKASGYGFNAGIYFKPNIRLSLGLDYRSQVNVKVDGGSADFAVPSSVANLFPATSFSTAIRLPSTLTLGIGYNLTRRLTFGIDLSYVSWKSYDSLIIDFTDNTDQLKDIHSPRMYQNVFIYRIGTQYKVSEKWQVRLGAYYDETPVKDGYLTPETPDANKVGVTIGTSYRLTQKFHLDASLLYIEGMKRTDTNIETQFGGTYKTKAVVPGISIEYVF